MVANSLYKKVYFLGFISLGKFYLRNFDLQTIGLPTLQALKVNVVMMMPGLRARVCAQCIFQAPLIIKHLVD
jgi:hypothetical protein